MRGHLPANWQKKIQIVPDYDGDECWEWTGAKNGPYGKVKVGYRTEQAHRAVYECLFGSIPDGLELDHLCFNRLCVNPEHLEPVTRQENMARSWRRRRWLEADWTDDDDTSLDEFFAAVATTGITDDPYRAIAEYHRTVA